MSNTIDHLGLDISSAMLSALTSGYEHAEPIKGTVQLEEQKRYLLRYINVIGVEDRKSIGGILVMNDKRNLLQSCAQGIIINLDILPPYIIEQMYDLMTHKMSKRG